jgi:AraC-like DNA-binding protein/mannose-6-phosphate isomerase-like protein (cupin superfamily)
MTRIIKKIPKPIDALSGLVPLARGLEQPRDYYHGRRHDGRGLPDNILLFHQRGARAMCSENGARHFHHRTVCIFPLLGRGRIVVNGRAFGLEPGRCALIAPYQFHRFTGFSAGEIDWLIVTFEGVGTKRDGTVFRPASGVFWEDLARLLEEFRSGSDAKKNGSRLACRLALLLDDLSEEKPVRAESRAQNDGGEDLLLKVHAMIAADMRRMLPIEEIGRRMGISASHLRARFRAGTGKSLGGFQREVRLQKAAELLAQTKGSVSEVGEACGWDSPFAFSRAFRRFWGRPPKRFSLFAQGR